MADQRIPSDYMKEICKSGCGEETCSYLMMGVNGFECAKGTDLEGILTQRRLAGQMVVRGDNCEGLQAKKDKPKN